MLVSGGDVVEVQVVDYDVGLGNVVLMGDVLLMQGVNVLVGEKVMVNLKSGMVNVLGWVCSVL